MILMSNDQVTAIIVAFVAHNGHFAGRSTLRSGDGYLYDCIICGGLLGAVERFWRMQIEIATIFSRAAYGALLRANHGH